MNLKELSIILAALLHDIGKFYRRAKRTKGHEELSGEFLEEFVPEFRYKRDVYDAVLYHHKGGSSEDTQILRNADRLSAKEREEEARKDREWRGEYRRLRHIFTDKFFYKLTVLDLSDFKSLAGDPREEATQEEYRMLWEHFAEDAKLLKDLYSKFGLDDEWNMRSYIMSMIELLKNYTFFIPSAPTVELEVKNSLYAHLKTTAAITSSIVMNEKRGIKGMFTLIMGDVAGIQKYVYGSRAYSGALKMLRARSIYLSMLTEAIARHIINRLGLLPLNIIFCSGGHFTIFSHYVEEKELKEIVAEIEQFLAVEHQGNVGLKLSYVYISEDDFEDRGGISAKLREVRMKLGTSGLALFKNVLQERYGEIFGPSLTLSDEDACYSCGSTKNVGEVDGTPLCEVCNSMRDLAKMIANAKYLVVISWDGYDREKIREITEIKEGVYTGPLDFVLRGLSCSFHIVENFNNLLSLIYLIKKSNIIPKELHVMKINDSNISEELKHLSEREVSVSFSLGSKFLGRHTPLIEERKYIEDFDELAKKSKGSKMIGYLKLDLDGLGDRFSREFSYRLADMLTFSEIISFIMEGVIDYLVSRYIDDKHIERLYLVYSGGDDLFMVGSWDAVVESLDEIYDELKEILRMSYGGPTMSATIHLEDPKTPVRIVSEIVSAKLRKVKEEGKDGLIISGRKLSWSSFKDCLKVSRELANYIEGGIIPRNLIFDLSRLIEGYENDPEKTWSVYRYRLRYILARNLEKKLADQVEGKLIESYTLEEAQKLKEEIIRNFIRLADIAFLTEKYTRVEGM